MSKKRLLAYTALSLNILVWGVALPITKKGFDTGLSPNTFLFIRMFLAGVFSLPIIYLLNRNKSLKIGLTDLFKIIIIEIIGQVVALVLLYEGLNKTSSIESTLISSTWPILATLGGIFFLHEKEKKNEIAGLLIAVIGTLIIVARPLLNHQVNGHLTGNIYVLIYTLLNVAYVLFAKKHYHKINKWLITFISFWTCTVAFGTILIFQGQSPITALTVELFNYSFWPLFAILYMAIFGSIVGLTLYLIGQSYIEASEAALFSYLNPLVAIPASYFLLSETIHTLDIIGIIIIVLGVALAEKR